MCLALGGAASPGSAQTAIHVGKSLAILFPYAPLDIGIAEGFFVKRGLDIDASSFAGDAKLQQAIVAGSIDIGIGSGPSLAFAAKGTPELAVAEVAGLPFGPTIVVLADSPYKTIADLKGKTASVTTVGSQVEWQLRELSRQQGWGSDGFTIVPLGEVPAQIAALKTQQIDFFAADIATGYRLEEAGEVRILLKFGDIIHAYVNSVIFASNSEIAGRPEAVRQFLGGWFASVAFMRSHRDETVQITAPVMNVPPKIAGRIYDETMRLFSDDGRFDAAGLAVLRRSFVEMRMLPAEPDMSTLYTERFLPGATR